MEENSQWHFYSFKTTAVISITSNTIFMFVYLIIGIKSLCSVKEHWIKLICSLLFTSELCFSICVNLQAEMIELQGTDKYNTLNKWQSTCGGLMFTCFALGHYLFSCNYYECSV